METQNSSHHRSVSLKSSHPRSLTKDPWDSSDDRSGNPDSLPGSQTQSSDSTFDSPGASPGTREQQETVHLQLNSILATPDLPQLEKDLSYLLRPGLYHPLSQLDIPPVFRSVFYNPSPDEPLSSSLSILTSLLKEGHFLLAAQLCATLLTSPVVSPTDNNTIFTLLYTRLACLELTGNTVLAAQESKALEDLSSTFYYVKIDGENISDEYDRVQEEQTRHIVPWPLRVLAVRLQSIGFGDVRRSIAGLYEIGLEARREIMRPNIDEAEEATWKARLADLGIRSVNALAEMGDLSAARRLLYSLQETEPESVFNRTRKALLYLRIGDVGAAKTILNECTHSEGEVLIPLLNMAEGRYDDAVSLWRDLLERHLGGSNEAMIAQNLAVCLLYTGQLNESRALLESLISSNHSFQSLVFNLSTIYELCSDKSRNLKLGLTEEISKQPRTGETNVDYLNADFKL